MSDWMGVADPQTLVLRPLSKGMVTNIPTQMIPPGGGLSINNLDVETIGLRSNSQWQPFINDASRSFGRLTLESGEYISDLIPFASTGAGAGRQILALTNKHLYVTTDGATWDAVTLSAGGSVTFAPTKPYIVQWARSQDEIFFVDGTTTTGIHVYDGQYLRKENPVNELGATLFNGAVTIAFISGRLVVGGLGESGGEIRVRWSSVGSIFTFYSNDYVDFIQTRGVVQKITAYEEYPIVFVDDGVYFGQPYGFDAALTAAWIFRSIETGGNSIVGPRAFVNVIGGVMFAGRDDFFYINALKRTEKGDFTVDSMKCPILRETIRNVAVQGAITSTRLIYDTHHKRVVVGMSVDPSVAGVSRFACYHTDTNAWSMFSVPFGVITSMQDISSALSRRWADIDTVDPGMISWEDYLISPNGSWYSELSGFTSSKIIVTTSGGYAYTLLRDLGVSTILTPDSSATPVASRQTFSATFVTGDMDMDAADNNKVAFKVGVRIGENEYTRTMPIQVFVRASTNKGRSWKDLGRVVIEPFEDEEEIHFRLYGNNMRFEFTFTILDDGTSMPPPFIVEEVMIRLRGGAQQVVRNDTRGD